MTKSIIEMACEAGVAFDSEEYPDIWMTYMNVGRKEIEAFANLVRADEREAIADEYWSALLSDMEHGVKCLNIQAAKDFNRTMPELSKFGRWLNDRSDAHGS